MGTVEIKKVKPEDLAALQAICEQTFFETFIEHNTMDNMQKYLGKNLSTDKLKNELINKNSEFYFATTYNKVIGYLKINFGQAQTEIKDDSALEIERIYVLKDFHGKKAGQLLFDKAIDIAMYLNLHYVWLGVWENNARALNFYKKNGFTEFDKHIFKLGDDEQTDIMMRLNVGDYKRKL